MSARHERRLDPEILNAFADGELEPEVAARVVMHLADCPADQRIVNQIVAMNAALVRACAGPMHEPVPERIRATITGSVPARPDESWFGRLRARFGTLGFAMAGGVLAAVVALVVFVPFGAAPNADLLKLGAVAARGPMSEALDQLASGDSRVIGDRLELVMLATFEDAEGYCREFALRADSGREDIGLACTTGTGWQIAAHAPAPTSAPDHGFAPASGAEGDPIAAQLEIRGAGFALDAVTEARARKAAWRPLR